MSEKKKKHNFPRIPLYMQSDKVLDQIFNEDGSESDAEIDELQEKVGSLANVAFSGSYNDLKDIPTNPDGSYNDAPLVERIEKLEANDELCITTDQIATPDEVLAMYNG